MSTDMVNNGKCIVLLISSGQEWQFYMLVTSTRMAISHVANNGNFTLLLTFSGQEWQFYIATDM